MQKKHLILSIAIAIIFAFFVGYGIEVFAPSPEYQDFCKDSLFDIQDEKECKDSGGIWNNRVEDVPISKGAVGRCSPSKNCHENLRAEQSSHDRIVFIVAVIIGLIVLILGNLLHKEIVSFGLTTGGLLSIIYGTVRYWQHANSTLKFVILGLSLGILIWLAYKKIK